MAFHLQIRSTTDSGSQNVLSAVHVSPLKKCCYGWSCMTTVDNRGNERRRRTKRCSASAASITVLQSVTHTPRFTSWNTFCNMQILAIIAGPHLHVAPSCAPLAFPLAATWHRLREVLFSPGQDPCLCACPPPPASAGTEGRAGPGT